MDRRTFLKIIALAGLPAPLLGCGPAAIALPELLAEFAKAAGADIAAKSVVEWVSGLPQAVRGHVQDLHGQLGQHGFDLGVYNQAFVYSYPNSPFFFYVIGNKNGHDGCAPFWTANVKGPNQGVNQVSLAEGPEISGLTYAAKEWSQRVSGIPASRGLFPTGTVQKDQGSAFDISTKTPVIYKTTVGTVAINYATRPEHRGTVSLVSKQDNGGVLMGSNYNITWA